MQHCKTCDYWKVSKGLPPGAGQCMALPPQLLLMPIAPTVGAPNGGAGLQALLPVVSGDAGCSLHKTALTAVES